MKLKTNKWIRMMSMILSLVLLISCVPNPTHAVGSDEFVNDQNVGGENAGINSQVGVTTEKIPMTVQIVAEDHWTRHSVTDNFKAKQIIVHLAQETSQTSNLARCAREKHFATTAQILLNTRQTIANATLCIFRST